MDEELPPAFKAAAAVLADRDRPPRLRKPLSVRCAAERFHTSHTSVQRAIATLTNPEPVSRSPRPAGRPRALTREEDDLLVSYVVWLQRGGFPISKAQLVAAANDLRRRKDADAADLGKNWYTRWLSEQPRLADTYARIKETYSRGADRGVKSSEAANVESAMTYFDNLKKLIALHRIGPSECWNEDEASLRIGCLGDEVQVIVTRTTRSQVLDPSNQEPSSLIGAANAAGDSMTPFFVFKALPFRPKPVSNAVDGNAIHFAHSETGFSNADISLEWLHHFNLSSWTKSTQAQRTGKGLEEWFGYDMWLRDPERPCLPPHKFSRIQRPEEDKIYRLLVLDGSAGHTTLDFIEYCIRFDIILAIIPSDFNYILQPLDLGVFQPLKHAYQRLLQNTLNTHSSFTQPDFVTSFKKVYDEGFTTQNITSGFKEAGIYPPNAQPSVMRVFSPQKNRETVNVPTNRAPPPPNHDHSRIRKDELKKKKAELREGRRTVQIEIERLRSLWQDDRLQRLSTGQRRLTFKGWLDHAGKADDFAFLENANKEIASYLKDKDSFFVGSAGEPSQQPQRVAQGAAAQAALAEAHSSVDVTMDDADDESNESAQSHEQTQENPISLDGDVSGEDNFHSLPPSPRLPASGSQAHWMRTPPT